LQATRERVVQLSRHADALTLGMQDLRRSLSWRLTAPLRGLASLFSPRVPWNIEHWLYRTYYAIPGLSATRKRSFILWLHQHAAALTRNTLSYRLNAEERAQRRAAVPSSRGRRTDDARAAAAIAKLGRTPLISIVVPVFNVDRQWLMSAVESVRRQFYPHWQLCIADDASTKEDTIAALAAIEQIGEPRVSVVRSPINQGIAGASNVALKQAQGEYVGFLDHDDALTRDALLEVAQRIDAEGSDLIYSDEDKLDEAGAHVEVHCKPDFNPDYFFSINYICHFLVVRRELIERVGGFRPGFDGAQDYDLLLRATELSTRIAHIPKVLYHWRKTPASTASASAAKPQSSDAGRRALSESMQRRNIACEVELGPYPNTFRVRRAIIGEPLVSIIVPFRDKSFLLQACVESIVAKTRYRNFEILCIDNGSVEEETRSVVEQLCLRDARVRVLRHDIPFNYSAINNFGAEQARGDHLVFLNNDTEVILDEWLDSMLEQSQRPEVGVVGARLWYADGTIQHAGVIVGPGGVAGHAHLLRHGDDPGYFARIRLPQNLSAVTFACAMTRRDVFREMGGLNDDEMKIAFNDIDYCLRAREAGYLVVYTPYALLHHFESKSRGYEDTPEKQHRFSGEIRYMQERHRELLARGDPYYNPKLSLSNTYHPDLSYVDELPE
jgi:GT2 family glycosyltransferase